MVSGDVIRYRVNSMSITRAVALTQRVSGCPTGIPADLRGLRYDHYIFRQARAIQGVLVEIADGCRPRRQRAFV